MMRFSTLDYLGWEPRCFRCGARTRQRRHDRPLSDMALYCYGCSKKRKAMDERHRQERAAFDLHHGEVLRQQSEDSQQESQGKTDAGT